MFVKKIRIFRISSVRTNSAFGRFNMYCIPQRCNAPRCTNNLSEGYSVFKIPKDGGKILEWKKSIGEEWSLPKNACFYEIRI